MQRITLLGSLCGIFSAQLAMLFLISFLGISAPGSEQQQQIQPPAKPQGAGSFSVESFEGGKAIPQRKPEVRKEPGKPPMIIYPASRSSTDIVKTSTGTGVFVDEGVEWQDKIAYLGLTSQLIVVDAKTKKTLWSAGVSAFWDTITFADRAKPGAPPQWELVLRSSKYLRYALPYELETGKIGELRGTPEKPTGEPITIRKEWSGSAGVREKEKYCLVGTAEEWTKLRAELFGPEPKGIPTASEVNFEKEMFLVCYAGQAFNHIELAVEDEGRVLLRLHRVTYQTASSNFAPASSVPAEPARAEHDYGLFVLPRRKGKTVILEYNDQHLIGGPPFWKEFTRLVLK